MRVVRWLVGLVLLGLAVGFVVSLVRPREGEVPHPVTR